MPTSTLSFFVFLIRSPTVVSFGADFLRDSNCVVTAVEPIPEVLILPPCTCLNKLPHCLIGRKASALEQGKMERMQRATSAATARPSGRRREAARRRCPIESARADRSPGLYAARFRPRG